MKFNGWIKMTLLSLVLVAPVSQASIVGYDVTFSNPSVPDSFKNATFDPGMIFVDNSITGPGVPNVDQWMFGVNWSITPFFGPTTSGSSSFSGSSCLSAPAGCASTGGLIFDTSTLTLLLGEVNDGTGTDGASLGFGPSGAVFTFPTPPSTSGLPLTVSTTVTITPKASVPEPGTLLLLALGMLALVVWKKYPESEPTLIRV